MEDIKTKARVSKDSSRDIGAGTDIGMLITEDSEMGVDMQTVRDERDIYVRTKEGGETGVHIGVQAMAGDVMGIHIGVQTVGNNERYVHVDVQTLTDGATDVRVLEPVSQVFQASEHVSDCAQPPFEEVPGARAGVPTISDAEPGTRVDAQTREDDTTSASDGELTRDGRAPCIRCEVETAALGKTEAGTQRGSSCARVLKCQLSDTSTATLDECKCADEVSAYGSEKGDVVRQVEAHTDPDTHPARVNCKECEQRAEQSCDLQVSLADASEKGEHFCLEPLPCPDALLNCEAQVREGKIWADVASEEDCATPAEDVLECELGERNELEKQVIDAFQGLGVRVTSDELTTSSMEQMRRMRARRAN